jgi:hypothetical protein
LLVALEELHPHEGQLQTTDNHKYNLGGETDEEAHLDPSVILDEDLNQEGHQKAGEEEG